MYLYGVTNILKGAPVFVRAGLGVRQPPAGFTSNLKPQHSDVYVCTCTVHMYLHVGCKPAPLPRQRVLARLRLPMLPGSFAGCSSLAVIITNTKNRVGLCLLECIAGAPRAARGTLP